MTHTRTKLLKALHEAASALEANNDDDLSLAVDEARALVAKMDGRWAKEPSTSFYCGKCACTQFYVTRDKAWGARKAGVSLRCAKCGKVYAINVQVEASHALAFPDGLES
jgi:RNase P subunit RPR2